MFSTLSALRGAKTISREFVSGICEKLTDLEGGDALFAGFVVRQGETLVGYVDSCPHAGWPLAGFAGRYLTRENDYILCAGHGALFKIEDGACVAGPCPNQALAPWPVAVRDGQVFAA